MNVMVLPLAVMMAASSIPQRSSVAIVSYRIAAPPNSVIRYAGEDYNTGRSGSLELIADPAPATVSVGSSVFNLPLTGPTDNFGSVTVSLMPQSEGYKSGLHPKGAKTRAAR